MPSKLPNPEKMSIGADEGDPGYSDDSLRCPLCAEIFQIPVTRECGHNLCWGTNEDPVCPRCMKKSPDMKFSVNLPLGKAKRQTQGSKLLVNSRALVSRHSDTGVRTGLDKKGNPLTGTNDITGAEETLLGDNRQEGGRAEAEVDVDVSCSEMMLPMMRRLASALHAMCFWIIRFYYIAENTVLSILESYIPFLFDTNTEGTIQKEKEQDTQGDPCSEMNDSATADTIMEDTNQEVNEQDGEADSAEMNLFATADTNREQMIQKEKEQDTKGDPCSKMNDSAGADTIMEDTNQEVNEQDGEAYSAEMNHSATAANSASNDGFLEFL
ncbi:uncharacterized protein LOC122814486 [Protopterus annectens]|uniref:uncharacterized protein LOC122814486 n=1 Tax=Protopterus annectens TaxID=7888 RepID=UPI001CFAA51F|nr:uncharacterized protein LOC122814486 [Protopterus annectens]